MTYDDFFFSAPCNKNKMQTESQTIGIKLVSIVKSYEMFINLTKFPLMFYLDGGVVPDTSVLTTLMTAMQDNDTNKASYTLSMNAIMVACANRSIPPSREMQNSLMNVFNTIIAVFAKPPTPLGPASGVPGEYDSAIRLICTANAKAFQTTLKKMLIDRNMNNMAASMSELSSVSDVAATVHMNMINIIEANCDFTPTMSLDEYLGKVYNVVQNKAINMVIANKFERQIFMLSFTPYFIFRYITKFIPSAVYTPADKGVRSATLRRVAIMCVYMFILYTLYGAYRLSSQIDPASSSTASLRLLIDSTATYVFNQDSLEMSNRKSLDALNARAQIFRDSSTGMNTLNREVESSRSKMTTTITSVTQLNAPYDSAVMQKRVWFAFLIIQIVVMLSLLVAYRFFPLPLFTYSLILSNTALVIAVTISFIVYLVRG